MKVGKNEMKKEIKEALTEIGVDMDVNCTKIVEGGRDGRVRMAVIGLQELDQKIKIMRERRRLKERRLRIDNDLTWKERKMRWNLEDIARRERGEGKRVWVNYGKIQIEGKWWRWEEEEEMLKDNKGRVWK